MNAITQLVLSDIGPLAFSVLALLLLCSVGVWIVFLLKTLSLTRGLYLQKKALRLLERIPSQEELRLRFAAMPDNPLKDLFEISDEELTGFLKSSPMAGHHRRGELMDLLERTLEAQILMAEKGLQRGQAFLATISVTAPFLGLFGTVIGVIDTFTRGSRMGQPVVEGLPMLVIWALALIIFGHWLLTKTRFGNWIFAAGGDAQAARYVGVPVNRVKILMFMFTAFCATVYRCDRLRF